MSRLLLPVLLLTSCAAEVAPRAEPGDPRVMPVGATAALDGSFSEGDGLVYAWSLEPNDGATLTDAASPFASFTADAPGLYTLSLEVCDAQGRCDVAETWARVDGAPGDTRRISSWSPDRFGGSESGAGLGGGLSDWEPDDEWCKKCLKLVSSGSTTWNEFCSTIPSSEYDNRRLCRALNNDPAQREGFCHARCAE